MKKFITEHQSPYLDLTTEASEILYRGHSDFQDIVVADSKEFGRMLVLDGVFQTSIKDEFIMKASFTFPCFFTPIRNGSSSLAAVTAGQPGKPSATLKSNRWLWSI